MDGGDCAESGARWKDCGKSRCHNNTVTFHAVYTTNNSMYASDVFAVMCSPFLWQTCAHRYQRRLFVNTPQESRDITGRCYLLSQDFSIDGQSDEDGGNWKFCEGRPRGHERFGACQQGLAATFTKDYHYVIFGAPGAYNWKGIVV